MKKRQTIFLIDDDEDILKSLTCLIRAHLKTVEVYSFTDHNEFLSHPKVTYADLYIIDIKLDNVDGRDLCTKLQEDITINIPCLFISGWDFDDKSFNVLSHHCIFDFIKKPFNPTMFINRVRVLLRHSELYKRIYEEEMDKTQRLQSLVEEKTHEVEEANSLLKKVESAIWETFNYSNLYTIILDKNLTIRLANFSIAKALGFNTEEELIGKCWLDFIKDSEKHMATKALHGICNKDLDYRETSFSIEGINGEPITVKWFNSYINDKFNGAFSIGVPLTKKITIEDNIDSIRSYYRDQIDKDRTMIQSIKKIATYQKTVECK